MIYFLVNNNYHIFDLETHLQELENEQIGLIQVPHTLKLIEKDDRFKKICNFEKLISKKSDYINIFKKNRIKNDIENKLKINKGDVLFVYTEYELMNQCIIEHFKKIGSKIYIIEEGIATYLQFFSKSEDKIGIKNKIKLTIIKLIYGLKNTKIIYLNKHVYYALKDELFDGVCFYFDTNQVINRKIRKILIKNNISKIGNLDNNSIIFLNEDMYNFFEEFNTYRDSLEAILNKLSLEFEKVYFKFHPREYNTPEKIQKITEIVKKFSNIEIINSKEPIELIINKIRPKFVASYVCVALINLYFMGLTPMYLYSSIKNIREQENFRNITEFLQTLEYNFIKDINDISRKYESNIEYDEKKGIRLKRLI